MGAPYKDELVVFEGASYFRALGAGQHYGLWHVDWPSIRSAGKPRSFLDSRSSGSYEAQLPTQTF